MTVHAFDLVAGFVATLCLGLILLALVAAGAVLHALGQIALRRLRGLHVPKPHRPHMPQIELGASEPDEEAWLKDFG
jgi:hypothetical protein